MTKQIPLSQGKFALVDDEDYDFLIQYGWYAHNNYVRASKAGGKILMHRLILNIPPNIQGDHINGDTLDNRRANLRICKNEENSRNSKGKIRTKYLEAAKYKGVNWDKRHKCWRARLCYKGKRFYGTYRKNIEDAARDYDELSLRYHGEFGRRNSC